MLARHTLKIKSPTAWNASPARRSIDARLDPVTYPFAIDQLIEDRKNLLPVEIGLLHLLPHGKFISMTTEEFVEEFAWNVDIAAQSFGRMTSQE